MTTQMQDPHTVQKPPEPEQPTYYPPQPQYVPYYQPQTSDVPVGRVLFWLFYGLVGFWVDLSLTLSLWISALILPFAFPFALALGKSGLYPAGYIYPTNDWLAYQSENTLLTLAGMVSVFGIFLLIFAILTAKPWFKFHQWLFRELGGVKL
jgi:hypothetical protein